MLRTRALGSVLLLAALLAPQLPSVARSQPGGAAPPRRNGSATVHLDVIGPRSTASVRSALAAHLGEVSAACGGDEDLLARVGFAIGPQGQVLECNPLDDRSADAAASACVADLLRTWRFRPGRFVTTVTWTIRLRATP